jgi:hypothetical protein
MSVKADSIENLPVDNTPYNKEIAKVLFKEKETFKNVFNELKESVFIVVLFLIFSSPHINDIIAKVYPAAANNYITLTCIKCVFIIVLFYFYKNFQFARSK